MLFTLIKFYGLHKCRILFIDFNAYRKNFLYFLLRNFPNLNQEVLLNKITKYTNIHSMLVSIELKS